MRIALFDLHSTDCLISLEYYATVQLVILLSCFIVKHAWSNYYYYYKLLFFFRVQELGFQYLELSVGL